MSYLSAKRKEAVQVAIVLPRSCPDVGKILSSQGEEAVPHRYILFALTEN